MTVSALPKVVPTFEQSLVALPAKLNNVPRDYRELRSLFMMLRQEDEAFKRAIHISHYKAKSCVATAQNLAEKMYLLIKGRVHLICKNEQTGVPRGNQGPSLARVRLATWAGNRSSLWKQWMMSRSGQFQMMQPRR